MEGHIWANLVDYEFMGISLDYSFTSVFSESDGNQQALILEAVPSAARQEADVKSVAADKASTEEELTTGSTEEEPRPRETKYPHQNAIFQTANSKQDALKRRRFSGKCYPPAFKKLNDVAGKRKENSVEPWNHSTEIQKVIQSIGFVIPRENDKQSLPNWDELKNPFRYGGVAEKWVELRIGNLNYYMNYVKLVADDSGTIYFKLLNNPNVSAKKSAYLILKFDKFLRYYCACAEFNISRQMVWNLHANFPDSLSLFLLLPKLK